MIRSFTSNGKHPLLGVILLSVLCHALSAQSMVTEIIPDAPTFYLVDLKGDDFFASKIYGGKALNPQPVVLSFFATWCVPCRAEVPELQKLSKQYPDVGFYLISVRDDPDKVLQWLNDLNVELQVLMDRYGRAAKNFDVIGESSSGKEVASLPSLFLINKQGKIVYQHTGYKEGDERILETKLKGLK